MNASEPIWMRTPHIWAYGFSHFKIHWVSPLCPFLAPTRTPMKCWILIGCSGTSELLIRCACAWAHADICVTIDSSKSQRPALTKIMLSLCYGLSWQMATSKVTFYGVSALKYAKDTRCSSWIPTKVWTRDDRKHDILFWDKYQFNLICQICCKAKTSTTSTEICGKKCPEH